MENHFKIFIIWVRVLPVESSGDFPVEDEDGVKRLGHADRLQHRRVVMEPKTVAIPMYGHTFLARFRLLRFRHFLSPDQNKFLLYYYVMVFSNISAFPGFSVKKASDRKKNRLFHRGSFRQVNKASGRLPL